MVKTASLFSQVLRIKSFVGTSRNALQVQIWTALIALLLLKYLKLRGSELTDNPLPAVLGQQWALSPF